MFYITKLFWIYGFCFFSVECFIPTLKVQKIDNKLIERKRQDTLDMCRMFNEENDRLERFKLKTDKVVNHNSLENSRRFKRDLNPTSSKSDIVEARRVETIVDKLYDDMAENGERVSYRQRKLSEVKAPKSIENKTARRFNFAPAVLLPPLAGTNDHNITAEPSNDQVYEMPWSKHWKHGIIPYFIDSNTYDTHLSDIIIKAFDYFEKTTCIRLQRLRERPTDKESLQKVEWLYITNPSGIRQCVHSNEQKENHGVQMVVFGYDCLSVGEILHEVMHILGFSHEHTRPDRDQYVSVLWDNIKPGYKKFFEIHPLDALTNLPYDYSSVLHYPSRAFSKNGQVTLFVESGVKIGQREGLSDIDIAKVTTIYSPQCMKRNKEYLLNTCPSVVNVKITEENVTKNDIENYFKDRLWPYGIVNYRIRDKMEFSIEERENLNAVIRHIQKETCIQFRDTSMYDISENDTNDNKYQDTSLNKGLMSAFINTNDTENDDIPDLPDLDNNISNTLKDDIATNAGDSREGTKTLNSVKQNTNVDYTDTDTDSQKKEEPEDNFSFLRRNVGSSKSSYTFGSLSKVPKRQRNKVHRSGATAGRRHAESTLTLIRSPEPGCTCPTAGKVTGDKILKINAGCFNSVNDLLHLFVHILGLDHQHNMHDRDSFIHILWDSLTPEIKIDMENKLPPAAAVGFPYDYQSVMHYPWLQIKNGVSNIMYPIWNDGWAMGHWQGLSSTDVNKLNLIYFEQCTLRREQAQE